MRDPNPFGAAASIVPRLEAWTKGRTSYDERTYDNTLPDGTFYRVFEDKMLGGYVAQVAPDHASLHRYIQADGSTVRMPHDAAHYKYPQEAAKAARLHANARFGLLDALGAREPVPGLAKLTGIANEAFGAEPEWKVERGKLRRVSHRPPVGHFGEWVSAVIGAVVAIIALIVEAAAVTKANKDADAATAVSEHYALMDRMRAMNAEILMNRLLELQGRLETLEASGTAYQQSSSGFGVVDAGDLISRIIDTATDVVSTATDAGGGAVDTVVDTASDIYENATSDEGFDVGSLIDSLIGAAGDILEDAAENADASGAAAGTSSGLSDQDIENLKDAVIEAEALVSEAQAAADSVVAAREAGMERVALPESVRQALTGGSGSIKTAAAVGGGALLLGLLAFGGIGFVLLKGKK